VKENVGGGAFGARKIKLSQHTKVEGSVRLGASKLNRIRRSRLLFERLLGQMEKRDDRASTIGLSWKTCARRSRTDSAAMRCNREIRGPRKKTSRFSRAAKRMMRESNGLTVNTGLSRLNYEPPVVGEEITEGRVETTEGPLEGSENVCCTPIRGVLRKGISSGRKSMTPK